MVSNLSFFYKFYQTCETSQCIDLSKSKNQYLLPETHPGTAKIYAAAKDLDNPNRTKTTHLKGSLYHINDAPGWLIREERYVTSHSLIRCANGTRFFQNTTGCNESSFKKRSAGEKIRCHYPG